MRGSSRHVCLLGAALLAITVILPSPASAQDTFKVAPVDGEFRRGITPGFQGIACVQAAKPGMPPDTRLDHCLRMGPLNTGMEYAALQKALLTLKNIPERAINDPRVVASPPDGSRTLMLPLATAEQGGKTGLVSYLVVIVDKAGVVQTMQLTGRPSAATEQLPFSSIRIGAAQDRVIDVLGLPSSVNDVPQIKGKSWSYAPFPFSIEFVSGQVYSVRLERPRLSDGRGFVPLKALPQ
jgi:hypothetical protein